MIEFGELFHRTGPTSVDIPRGEADQNVRSSKIGFDLIGIKLFVGRILVLQVLVFAPGHQVVGSRRANGADARRFPDLVVGSSKPLRGGALV